MIEGLGCIRLLVRDLERSIEFYGPGLRFSAVSDGVEAASDDVVRMQVGTLCLELERCPPGTTVEASNGRGIQLSVSVRGLDAYHDALVERGLEPGRPRDADGERSFSIEDPDGFVWRFTQSDR